jgi:O-antigen/teichoic acid export membrane protein
MVLDYLNLESKGHVNLVIGKKKYFQFSFLIHRSYILHMNKKSFLKHAGVAFIVRILGAIAGLIMNLVIARTLSVEQSGLFFLAFALCSAIGMLCTLGLTNAFIRFIGGYHAEGNWGVIKGVVNKGFISTFICASVVGVVVYLSSGFISEYLFDKPLLAPTLKIIAFVIPLYAVYQLLSRAFQGLHKPISSILFQNISTQILVAIGVIAFSIFSFEITSSTVAFVLLIASFFSFMTVIFLWFRQSNLNVKADFSKTRELVASAKPLWVMMLMVMMVQYSGQIITGIHVSSEDVAYFSVAQRVAMLTSFVLIAVNLVAAPRFAASAKQGKDSELRATSLFCSRIMVIMATPVVVFMLVFPEFILGFFGEQYKQAALLLQILVIGQFINVITGSVGFLLNMTGHEKDMRNVVFLSGPLAVILGLMLTPMYGTTGAAVATAIALASQNLLAVFMVKKRLGFNTLNLWKQ